MTDVKTAYPARYYASYDSSATQPTPVTGWYDTWDMGNLSDVPDASSMIAISESDWNDTINFHRPTGRGVQNGKIINYNPPPTALPLVTQAENALSVARQTMWNEYGSINEATPDPWVTYLKALMAIVSGSDTTSTVLPTAPE